MIGLDIPELSGGLDLKNHLWVRKSTAMFDYQKVIG